MRFGLRKVHGESMSPCLHHDQVVIVASGKPVKPGDIIVINHDGLEKIKRLSLIGDQGVFVLGDNQAHSTDSRQFGWIPLTGLVGKVVWPRRLDGSA